MTVFRPQIQNWSYNHDPANSDLDAVRFLVTDTNHEDKLLDDNEINWLLSQEGNVRQAAIKALRNLIAIFSRHVDTSGKAGSKAQSQRVESFKSALAELLEDQSMAGLNIFAGGQSVSGKESIRSDSDRVKPVFGKNMFDNPRAVTPNREEGSSEGDA